LFLKVLDFGGVTVNERYQCFDVAYESCSGDAMIVYYNDSATVNPLYPKYRVWNGSDWSGENDALQVGTGDIYWVVLASKPDSDEILMLTLDSNAYIFAQVWNGTGWGNRTQLEGQGSFVASATDYQCLDVVYESQSGYGFIAWGNSSDTLKYRRWKGDWTEPDGNWGTSANEIRFVKLAADPSTNYVAAAYLDSAQNIGARIWTGFGWGISNILTTSTDRTDRRCFDLAWETKSDKEGLIVYDTNANDAKYRTINGTVISGENSTGYTGNGKTSWVVFDGDLQSDDIMMVYIDSQNDIISALWNGTGWEKWHTAELDSRPTAGQRFDVAYTDTSGYFVSSAYDSGIEVNFSNIRWTADIPAITILKFRTRTSPDGITWSNWSDLYNFGERITNPRGRWIQYFAWFETSNVTYTPILYDISIGLNRPDVILKGIPGDRFGWSVSRAGDVNSDGYDDVIIGAPYNDTKLGGISDAGAIYVFNGNATMTNKTALDADNITYGEMADDHFGWSVANAGNVDGVDKVEVIVGAPGFDLGPKADVGKVYVYTTGGLIPEFHSIIIPILFLLILIAIVKRKCRLSIKCKKSLGVID